MIRCQCSACQCRTIIEETANTNRQSNSEEATTRLLVLRDCEIDDAWREVYDNRGRQCASTGLIEIGSMQVIRYRKTKVFIWNKVKRLEEYVQNDSYCISHSFRKQYNTKDDKSVCFVFVSIPQMANHRLH